MTELEKWKNDFKEFISELSMPRDDYKGIMEYINEVPNETMDDCISRQEAINCVTFHEFRHRMVEDIKALPPVTPKEKTGHWKVQHTNLSHLPSDTIVTCLECGHTKSRIDGEILNFCPKCGARMVSE